MVAAKILAGPVLHRGTTPIPLIGMEAIITATTRMVTLMA